MYRMSIPVSIVYFVGDFGSNVQQVQWRVYSVYGRQHLRPYVPYPAIYQINVSIKPQQNRSSLVRDESSSALVSDYTPLTVEGAAVRPVKSVHDLDIYFDADLIMRTLYTHVQRAMFCVTDMELFSPGSHVVDNTVNI